MLNSTDLAREMAGAAMPCERPGALQRPWQALARLAVPSVELFSAAVLLGWAGLLLGRPDLFGSAAGYAAMREVASQTVWGIGMAATGVAQITAVATRDAKLRLLGCGGATACWAFIAVMLSQVAGVRTGGVTYGLLSCFLLWRNLRSDK